MRLYVKRDVYEGQVLPVARLALVNRVDGEKNMLARHIIIRFPFKRWKKFIDPRTFMHDEGWCVYRWMFGYSYARKNWMHCGIWVPITVDEI